MKRRLLMITSLAIVVSVAALAMRQDRSTTKIPLLERATKHKSPDQTVAILLEMGLKDAKPSDWSGQATFQNAKVKTRDGYRFRKMDKLLEPNGWEAKSRFSIRAPNNPVIRRVEGVVSVGVVFHLESLQDQPKMTLSFNNLDQPPQVIDLSKILAGEAVEMAGGSVQIRLVSTANPVKVGPTEDDNPAATYGPDGSLWIAYTSYTLRDPKRTIQSAPYESEPNNFLHLYHPEFAEQIFVRCCVDGKWADPIAVTDNRQDIARCSIAVDNDGTVWPIYSAHRGDNFDLYTRPIRNGKLGDEERLTTNPGPDLTPVSTVDGSGKVWIAFQSWLEDGIARIGTLHHTDTGWSEPSNILVKSGQLGNCWHPAIAAGPNGKVAVAFDHYTHGDYDIAVAFLQKGNFVYCDNLNDYQTAEFQARPTIAFAPGGLLWLAHEVGPEKWGKDYGALDGADGNPLFNARAVAVIAFEEKNDGNWQILQPFAQLPKQFERAPQIPFDALKTNGYERRPRQAHPQICIDGESRVWLTYRRNFCSRYSSHPGAYWLTYARRLQGNDWSPEIELHYSDGLLDHRPAVLPNSSGGLLVVHNTDGRFTTPEMINNEIYLSQVALKSKANSPDLKNFIAQDKDKEISKKRLVAFQKEKDQVKTIRDYRIKYQGKELQPLRGEYHRHTSISWDGAADGSLEDMFRYAIDAVAFDWIGNGDHDNGAGREYPWWLTQKWTDAYLVKNHFTPMHTYERSVSYPHGHRNVMFAKRGIMTLPRLSVQQGEKKVAGISPNDTKMLYKYLHEFDGICAVHTSATGMGTDWRDNDPVVEPIVEIYQGDRMSYEMPNAPRAGYDPKTGKEPINIGGWRPLGFLDHALKTKGYKLAFQASSDHWSTHISYFVILAENPSREAMLEAVKKRHCYGATDNIVVDLRSGAHIQGDAFTTPMAPTLEWTVLGTNRIAKIDVIKDSEVVATFDVKADKHQHQWTDPNPDAREHYYYIRVLQEDGEVAWASPMWIRKE